jgi:hypothetical protein
MKKGREVVGGETLLHLPRLSIDHEMRKEHNVSEKRSAYQSTRCTREDQRGPGTRQGSRMAGAAPQP